MNDDNPLSHNDGVCLHQIVIFVKVVNDVKHPTTISIKKTGHVWFSDSHCTIWLRTGSSYEQSKDEPT